MALPVVLAGCTPGTGKAANTSGTPNGTLSYWFTPATADAAGVASFKKYNITPFTKKYPDVTLQAVQKSSSTINQQIQVALSAGKGPDIVTAFGVASQVLYAKAGYLADLTAFASENGWSDTLLPWALEVSKVDGKLVMIPQAYETLILFYNKTLFAENGWTPPRSRAELEDLAAKMVAKGITPFAAGNSDYQGGTEWLVSSFFNSIAGPAKVHDALTQKVAFTDQVFVDSIDLLKTYFQQGWFGGGATKYFATTDPQKYTQLAKGEAGMYISGTWEFVTMPSYFKSAGSDFDWAPVPPLADGVPEAYPLSIGNALSVNSKSQNKFAGSKYLDWNIKDTATMWANVVANGQDALPVKFNPSDIPSAVDPRLARQYTALAEASQSGAVGYTTWTSWGGQSDQYIVDNIDKVVSGSLSTTEFLKALDAAFKQDVSKGNLPTVYSTGKPAA
ncbi:MULTISPECIES: ABC transporter substrate-binding protein [unclassified Microbacterium]|uniref:ABC transporter substrate-binding protein n=1 Tax=unclassified Microbacterium TaxID=2609290 RepID=UPI00365F01C0